MTVDIADSLVANLWARLPGQPGRSLDFRAWKASLLLHLHRFPDPAEPLIADEAQRIADMFAEASQCLPDRFKPQGGDSPSLADTELIEVTPEIATTVHKHFHYLRSPRREGAHFALVGTDGWQGTILAQVTLSPFDLSHLIRGTLPQLEAVTALILSRLVTFPWSPRNTASAAMARVRIHLRTDQPEVGLLFTYLDPNVGFRGSVYRADNWTLFGQEHKERYLFLDKEYVSDRALIARYATADFEHLSVTLGHRLVRSAKPLTPLWIYCRQVRSNSPRLGNRMRHVHPDFNLVGR